MQNTPQKAGSPAADRSHRLRRSWATEDEIAFVDRLASTSVGVTKLRGYLRGLSSRTNFGSIDANKVIEHARAQLSAAERAPA
jgi:hypothetical protein